MFYAHALRWPCSAIFYVGSALATLPYSLQSVLSNAHLSKAGQSKEDAFAYCNICVERKRNENDLYSVESERDSNGDTGRDSDRDKDRNKDGDGDGDRVKDREIVRVRDGHDDNYTDSQHTHSTHRHTDTQEI